MQKKIWFYISEYRWLLPIVSAIFFIFSIPPVSVWWLSLIGYVPLFFFIYLCNEHNAQKIEDGCAGKHVGAKELLRMLYIDYKKQATVPGNEWILELRKNRITAVFGTVFFTVLYGGYVGYSTLSGFQWLEQASYFVTFVQVAGTLSILFLALVYAAYVYLAILIITLFKRLRHMHAGTVAVVMTLGTIVPEFFFFHFYAGFNYGAVFFAGQEIPPIRGLIDTGSPMVISFVVMIINMCVCYVLLVALGKAPKKSLRTVAGVAAAVSLSVWAIADQPNEITDTVRVSIVQEASRDAEVTFGKVVDGVFTFPLLEAHIIDAAADDPDMIIYPFAPWNGVISESIDNSRFDRDVVGMSDEIFSMWLKTHVPEDVVFVAWYTAYRGGEYHNQIGYFKNGELIGLYVKEKLFPFFDYVPKWALAAGVVSLPYDATPATENEPYLFDDDIAIGTLVCSEIGDMSSTYNSAQGSRMIFSLGSETMFHHQIPSEYNALRASLSAELHDIPVVRANKFGPSVVFDGNGEEIGRIEFEQTGVLTVDIPVPAAKE